MKNILLKLTSVTLLLLVGIGGLFAAGEDERSDEVELRVIVPWSGGELEGFLSAIEQYMEENPGVKVSYQVSKPEDISVMLANQFAAGKASADLIDTAWGWYIKEQAEQGHVLELSDTIKEDEFISGALDEVTIDSGIYGVSGVGGITVPEYRTSFFEENGLQDPASINTKSEFISLLNDIQDIDGIRAPLASGGGVGWTFTSILETWILAFGGVDMHQALSKGELSWTSASVRNLIKDELLPLIQDGYFDEPAEYSDLLQSMWQGKTGIFVGDSSDTQSVEPAEERGVFLLPGQTAVMFWYDYWFIPQYTEHPEEAKKLLYFLSTKGQRIQVESGGRVGTYKNIPFDSYPEAERSILGIIENVSVVRDLDDTIGGEFQSSIWNYLKLLWSSPDEETLDEVLEELQRASEATLKG